MYIALEPIEQNDTNMLLPPATTSHQDCSNHGQIGVRHILSLSQKPNSQPNEKLATGLVVAAVKSVFTYLGLSN